MRALLQLGYRLRRLLLRWLRLRTRGVKVMVFNEPGALLLIRNGYGDRRLWVLPGGGVGRRETPAAAAAREVREEVGLEVRELAPVATYESAAEGKRDTVHLFRAVADGPPVMDRREVEEACFFPLDALPESVSAATRRRIMELERKQPAANLW
jgi:ADP-ribose pyrophosphatase YjhB (NUDIX family)